VFIDAIHVKIRDGHVANRPVYTAIGVNLDGERDILGLWVGGVANVCIVVCDGLKGLPEPIAATWPAAVSQTCVIHLLRNSFRYASRRDWAGSLVTCGRPVPGDHQAVGKRLGGVHSVPGVRRRDPLGHLHRERD
jgi:transposase-like protein